MYSASDIESIEYVFFVSCLYNVNVDVVIYLFGEVHGEKPNEKNIKGKTIYEIYNNLIVNTTEKVDIYIEGSPADGQMHDDIITHEYIKTIRSELKKNKNPHINLFLDDVRKLETSLYSNKFYTFLSNFSYPLYLKTPDICKAVITEFFKDIYRDNTLNILQDLYMLFNKLNKETYEVKLVVVFHKLFSYHIFLRIYKKYHHALKQKYDSLSVYNRTLIDELLDMKGLLDENNHNHFIIDNILVSYILHILDDKEQHKDYLIIAFIMYTCEIINFTIDLYTCMSIINGEKNVIVHSGVLHSIKLRYLLRNLSYTDIYTDANMKENRLQIDFTCPIFPMFDSIRF